ncbi:unnamed protein product [Didymodactylos carnosus]|uniref:3'-5' exonuclease domain-containing protein n=1 Tax=Didymodactylos carnosus TaxID=1234261 RepID=A0A814WSQ5_9BILA|nr:unnamed protein product [Didymodactylos carnosus]CAF3969937.1 unnamed protein product [Didymodactylos carnosus]
MVCRRQIFYSRETAYSLLVQKPSSAPILNWESIEHTHFKKFKPPCPPKTLEDTTYFYVDTIDKLNNMMDHLKEQQELAVDCERHSYRSYQVFTCLLQISTRSNDYLVDTLVLREELHVLNTVFANLKTLKVFHAGTSDIEWLYNDFGIYIINMFDTFHAAEGLNLTSLSLAYLLKEYCHIVADKQYQLADWRIS